MLASLLLAAAIPAADLTTIDCGQCPAWNAPHAPFRLHGDSWYVGTAGLSAVLVATRDGLVLFDAALPQSAPLILANIESAGFDPANLRWLLNSHPHYDHAGGLAALQRLTGAKAASSERGADALRAGNVPHDDAQHGHGAEANAFPPVADVVALQDGERLTVGDVVFTMHATPGHTPGGTTWQWRSCAGGDCLSIVYADSITAVSSPGFRFSDQPALLAQFEATFALIESLECDLIVSAHPSASRLFEKVAAGAADTPAPALIDPRSCRDYAATGRAFLAQRLAKEAAETAD